MPFYTPLNCVEVLLAAIGLRDVPNMQDLTISLLDLVYLQVCIVCYTSQTYYYCTFDKGETCLQREKLFSHLQYLTEGHVSETEQEKRDFIAMESNALFLAAAVILCGTFFSCTNDETARLVASKLSGLIDINPDDIWSTANILLVMAIQE